MQQRYMGSYVNREFQRRNRAMKRLALIVLMCAPFLLWSGLRIYKSVTWDIEVTGHLKRAADANTVEMAAREMETAVGYLERNGITTGYTSILYRTPAEDVAFWHDNLRASLDELKRVPPTAGQLERSNILMKLRETLMDSGDKSSSVTEPSGISVYPANGAYALIGWAGLILFGWGMGLLYKWANEY